MDAQAVLATARSGSAPASWFVWPLRRDYVTRSAFMWAGASVFGFLLFIPACFAALPSFPHRSAAGIIFTSVILVLLGALGVGGAVIALYDLYRLRHADDYLLVVTPEDYVKSEPGKVTHVPLQYIGDITMRGVTTPADDREDTQTVMRSGVLGGMIGSVRIRRQPKSPPSLAFVDKRTDKAIVVSTDQSFDSLLALEEILSDTVRQNQRRRSS